MAHAVVTPEELIAQHDAAVAAFTPAQLQAVERIIMSRSMMLLPSNALAERQRLAGIILTEAFLANSIPHI